MREGSSINSALQSCRQCDKEMNAVSANQSLDSTNLKALCHVIVLAVIGLSYFEYALENIETFGVMADQM